MSAWIMECIFGSSKVAPTLFFSISHLTTKDPLSTCLLLSILISSWFIRYLIMNPLKKISIMGEEKIGILYFRHHSAYRERWPRLGLYNFSCITTCQYTCIKVILIHEYVWNESWPNELGFNVVTELTIGWYKIYCNIILNYRF